MTDLCLLAQRCIDAPGHATDLLIFRYLHPEFASDDWQPYGMGLRHKYDSSDARCLPPPEHTPKRWTTSIDAAMTLIPEGWSIGLGQLPGAGWIWRAHLRDHNNPDPTRRAWHDKEAHTPAQAICVAALMTRRALMEAVKADAA